ncbi:unnamed protein product [Paramecium octaurelia]|uniref:Uncharacterized protein n=1 Tax=Paramecium octaurelia TaxID=43137 RepID=A0A8S1SLT5_PAROT|nr:unnamed protein product [Paramecium octaurelia]
MLKQQDQQQDGFVSFMLEKEDSYVMNHSENPIKNNKDEDYYKQLSRQFYGQKSEVKLAPKIDPAMLKYKIVSRTFITNSERQKPAISVPTISEQLQQQIQKLLSSSKPQFQSSIQSTQKKSVHSTQKINKIKNLYMQQQPAKFNIPIPIKKMNILGPRTYRLRIEESADQFNQITLNSYRSTLNSSTKSIAKQDRNTDNCYPIKLQTQLREDNSSNVFKISFRNKY